MIPFRLSRNVPFVCSFLTNRSLITYLLNAVWMYIAAFLTYRIPCYLFLAKLFDELYHFNLLVVDLFTQEKGGNRLSLWLRPIFEYRKVQSVFGFGIIFALLLFGIASFILPVRSNSVFAGFPNGSGVDNEETVIVNPVSDLVLSTERRYQIPVELISISQKYHSYHPAVDMRARFGSDIRPITAGVVRDVIRSSWGYGQAIIVAHEDDISSMYAHVKNISVDIGSPVDQNTVIASVGLTGTTTGPHLHLEIYQKGVAVNPQPFLGY